MVQIKDEKHIHNYTKGHWNFLYIVVIVFLIIQCVIYYFITEHYK